jgi:UTP-glucose-1-phosphate uridylyltransferase
VLAAGMGSRYGGLKQLDSVGPSGEIIIDYSVYDAVKSGFGKVVFVIRKNIEKTFKDSIAKRYDGIIDIDFAFQEIDALIQDKTKIPMERTKPWGTGHAVLVAKNIVKEPFAVINADDFYGREGYKLLAKFLSKSPSNISKNIAEYAMVGFKLNNTLSENGSVSRGICNIDSNSYLNTVTELTKIEQTSEAIINTNSNNEITKLTGNEIVSLNMWGFYPDFFDSLETLFQNFIKIKINEPKSEFYLPAAVDTIIQNKIAKVKVLENPEQWFGVTYKEDKPDVINKIKNLIKSGKYPEKLF